MGIDVYADVLKIVILVIHNLILEVSKIHLQPLIINNANCTSNHGA